MGAKEASGFDRSSRRAQTKRDYEAALKQIEDLMGVKRNSHEGDTLDVLVTLVEAYN